MVNEIAFISKGVANLNLIKPAEQEVDFAISGFLKYRVFGQDLWLTTTHISIILVIVTLVIFAAIANRAIKRADPNKVPGTFLNIVEFLVESIDKLAISGMGAKHGMEYANYIGTLMLFLFISNISGLLGLRPPTADYGVTLALGLITFVLIQFNGFKYNKLGHITGLFKPLPFLFPINLIGEIATPFSLSLRLFGNVMAGTVMLGLLYGLLPRLLVLVWPAALHFYFDLFSGAIQTYVFVMLTMVFVSGNFDE